MALDTAVLIEGIVSSAKASIAVILVMIYGYVTRKLGAVSKEGESNISKVGSTIFLPCLLFSEIGPLSTAENLASYWPIIPFSLAFQLVSLLVGLGSQKIFKFPHYYVPMFIFNNVTSLPLLLIQSLSKTGTFDDLLQPGETMQMLLKRGTVYILINALVGNMTRFALGPYLMKSHEPWTWMNPFADDPLHKSSNDSDESALWKHGPVHLPTDVHSSDPHLHPLYLNPDRVQIPGESHEDGGHSSDAHSDSEVEEPSANRNMKWKHRANNGVQEVWVGLKKVMNPPLVGGLAAVFCGLVPFLHMWLFGQGWLSPLADSIENIGGLYTALQMFVLGAHLYSKKGTHASIPTLIWLFLWRFFLAPALSIGTIYGIRQKWPTAMVEDPMLDYVLMLSNVGPPALTLSAIATMADLDSDADGAVSRIITLSYAVTPLIALPITAVLQFASKIEDGQ